VVDTLIAADPGKRDCGIAFFVAGVLADAAWLAPPNGGPYEVAQYAAAWTRRCMMNLGDAEGRVSTLVVEGQQIYRVTNLAQSNDLLDLAQTVGGVMARIDAFDRKVILPRVWTGGIPKPIRQRHYLASASEGERSRLMAIKPAAKRHNVIDAVCLGAWYLGRVRVPSAKEDIQ
jgi:hypothetical protein